MDNSNFSKLELFNTLISGFIKLKNGKTINIDMHKQTVIIENGIVHRNLINIEYLKNVSFADIRPPDWRYRMSNPYTIYTNKSKIFIILTNHPIVLKKLFDTIEKEILTNNE